MEYIGVLPSTMEIFMTAQAPVELLCLTQRAPLLLHGTIAQPESNRWVFTSDEPVELSVIDCNAIVNTNDDRPMMTLHIVEQEDGKLVLHTISSHPREKRSYPRLFSLINLQLMPVTAETQMTNWMNETTLLSEVNDTWLHPEPFMNFSVNGVAFEWHEPLATNTKLLVALKENDNTHRCIARVVRCNEEEVDSWEVALYFEQMADKAIDYLVQLTMRLQDSML